VGGLKGDKKVGLTKKEWIKKGKRVIDIKKGELPRLKCFHNGIILIVNSFHCKYMSFFIII